MKTALLVVADLLFVLGVLPYLRDILRRQTKPRLVSWFNWTLLTGIAAAASIADKQYASAFMTAGLTVMTLIIVLAGLRYGDRKFDAFDVYCQAGATAGIILWFIFSSPLVAILATVSIDFIAGLPTLKHSWQKPYEETVSAYIWGVAGGGLALTVAVISHPNFGGLVYPIYIPVFNAVLSVFILISPHKRPTKSH